MVGHIGCLLIHPFEPLSLDSEHLRKVWEISEHVGLLGSPGGMVISFSIGGKNNQLLELGGGSLEENWEQVLHFAETGQYEQEEEAV